MIAALMVGCGEKKPENNIITEKVVEKAPSAPVKMQEYQQQKEFEWLGSTYRCEIHRVPVDSLAMVEDESGQKFVDNSVRLVIRRADGGVFFDKTFKKKSFESFIGDDYRRTGILEGLVFDRVDGSSVVFAASVSHPQTDEYIPLVVRISRTGSVDIERDTQLDTSSQYDEEL